MTTKEYMREYYRKNREKIAAKQRKYSKENADMVAAYNSQPEVRQKNRVRAATLHKYGKLLAGYQYHHTTMPYHVDEWEILTVAEHKKIHSGVVG